MGDLAGLGNLVRQISIALEPLTSRTGDGSGQPTVKESGGSRDGGVPVKQSGAAVGAGTLGGSDESGGVREARKGASSSGKYGGGLSFGRGKSWGS